MDQYIGTKLDGRYLIEATIGVGGMANVYRATDVLENRTVAVKILRDEFMKDEDFVRRFRNESKAIALLSHPNIVKVYDVSVTDKVQYIVMEFVDGITLKEYMQQRKVLTWQETLHFIKQTLEALKHAHSKGIVHRDIKPQNIMVLEDSSIRVMDFGIAHFNRAVIHTTTNRAIGSVHYISPEQAKGEPIDARADIYSTGVMMYEMLTGRLPFESDSAVSVAIKQISDAAVPPLKINPDIPPALAAITMKAMEKDVEKRYQTAGEMLDAIHEYEKDPSVRFEYQYLATQSPTRMIDKVVKGLKRTKKTESQPTGKRQKKKRSWFKVTTLVFLFLAIAFAVGGIVLCNLIFRTSGLFSTRKDIVVATFTGMTVTEAKKNTSFQIVEEDVYNPTVNAGVIFDQSPKSPKIVKEGSKVTVKVSLGKQSVKVPDLSGMTRGEALKALTALGLSAQIELQQSSTVEDGYLIGFSPEAGSTLTSGDTVVLYVSRSAGTDSVSVPDVTSLTSTRDVSSILESMRLRLGTVTKVADTSPAGTILEQDPAANTVVTTGTKVNIKISTGLKSIYVKSAFSSKWVGYTVKASWKSGDTTVEKTFEVTAGALNWSFYVTGTIGTREVSFSAMIPGTSSYADLNKKITLDFDSAKAEDIPSSASSSSSSESTSSSDPKELNVQTVSFTEETPPELKKATIKLSADSGTAAPITSVTIAYDYSGDGTITAESSNKEIAQVSVDKTNKKITISTMKDGTATITVKASATSTYAAASAQYSLTVATPSPTPTPSPAPSVPSSSAVSSSAAPSTP